MHAVDVVTTIRAVAPDQWDSLAGDRAFLQHRWLRLTEAVLAEHRPRYLLVHRQGRLVAAAVGALQSRLQNPTLDARFGWLVRRSPFLHVAAPMTATDGLLVRAGSDAGILLDAIHSYVRRERRPFCILDHLPASQSSQHGYRRLAWLPDARLDLAWASFEEYLAALPRKRRHDIQRMGRRAAREGIAVEPLIPTPEVGPALDRLVADVVRRHGGTRHYGADLFGRAAAALGADLTVLVARRDGRPVGCIALLRSDDDIAVRWFGRDYERTAGTAIYHALVSATVAAGISTGARRLHMGAAGYETKKQFGASLVPRSRLFAARSRTVTWLMGKLGHHFDPPALGPVTDADHRSKGAQAWLAAGSR
jgi:predicted N-acyltransferase